MQKRENKYKITDVIICVVVFLLLAAGLMSDRVSAAYMHYAGQHSQYTSQSTGGDFSQIVLMGDSILGQYQDETSVAAQLEQICGRPVLAAAFGGTCMARMNVDGQRGNTKDVLCMEALATAMFTEDFGAQQNVHIRENGTEHFDSVIDRLATVDFGEVQVLFIGQGINDYHAGIPIRNEKDSEDAYTFAGALRRSVRLIQERYPHLRIILVTPTYSWYPGDGKTGETKDFGGGSLDAYVEEELRIADEMGIEVIDLYHDFYAHDSEEDCLRYTTDGVHPNEQSRVRIAEVLAEYLK